MLVYVVDDVGVGVDVGGVDGNGDVDDVGIVDGVDDNGVLFVGTCADGAALLTWFMMLMLLVFFSHC